MAPDTLSFIYLIINASIVVKIVIFILVLASIVSWTMIFSKYSILKVMYRRANDFENDFWHSEDIAPLFSRISKEDYQEIGIERIFIVGFKEFARLRKQDKINADRILEGAQRNMRIQTSRELDLLETNLSFLATVGSTSPYIGLFGTVWGIMNSFQALGNVQQATISMVAPGISEALIATALGLFAAIPAVIAYNRFSHDIQRLLNRYDNFTEEFLSILQRHTYK